jgi:hypothetical protein
MAKTATAKLKEYTLNGEPYRVSNFFFASFEQKLQ